MTEQHAVMLAAGLLEDGSHPEYRRGVLELLAELFPVVGRTIDERRDDYSALIAP